MLTFCGLALSSASLWTFPAEAIVNGGIYFIIIYLLAVFTLLFPLLHLEIFVGQRHQTDVCRVFRSYGRAYECFAVLICIFTFLISQYSIQDAYVVIVHLGLLMTTDIETLLNCRSERYKEVMNCASLLNHMRCQANVTDSKGVTTYSFQKDACVSDSGSKLRSMYSVEYRIRGRYADSLPEVYHDSIAADIENTFHVKRLCLYWAIFLVFILTCFLKTSCLRRLIAILYAIFAFCFLTSAIAFISFTKFHYAIALIWYATTPESLLSIQTYAKAARLAVSSGGVGFCGVMSAASLRSRNKNSYRLAAVMIFSNIIASLLSCLIVASIVGIIVDTTYNRKFLSVRKHPTIFVVGQVTEVILHEKRNRFVIVVLYVIANILAKVLPFFAPLITAVSFIRSRYRQETHPFATRVRILVTICIAGFAITTLRAVMPLRQYLHHTVPCIRISYDSIVPFIMVFVFVLFYGEFEYMQDIWELYPEDEPRYFSPRPTSSLYTALYYMIPYISLFLALMGITKIREDEHGGLRHNSAHEMLMQGIGLVIVTYFLSSVYETIKTNEWSFLFGITPEHPSYARIHPNAPTYQDGAVAQTAVTAFVKENNDHSEKSNRSRRSRSEEQGSKQTTKLSRKSRINARSREGSRSKENDPSKIDAHSKESDLTTPVTGSRATSVSVPASTGVSKQSSPDRNSRLVESRTPEGVMK